MFLSSTMMAGVAYAASNGSLYLETSGANFRGTYTYDAYVDAAHTGVRYSGTLNNWGTDAPHQAYLEGQVSGYGMSILGSAAPRTAPWVSNVVYDPAATRVDTSRARVCRDRTVLPKTCAEGTYNR